MLQYDKVGLVEAWFAVNMGMPGTGKAVTGLLKKQR
jgi:hypothetical protein